MYFIKALPHVRRIIKYIKVRKHRDINLSIYNLTLVFNILIYSVYNTILYIS